MYGCMCLCDVFVYGVCVCVVCVCVLSIDMLIVFIGLGRVIHIIFISTSRVRYNMVFHQVSGISFRGSGLFDSTDLDSSIYVII